MSDAEEQIEEAVEPSFPTWFPDGCPPNNTSNDASEEVYRIVKTIPLAEADFLSHFELGTAVNAPSCARCGVSVFDSLSNAMHRQRLSPRLGEFVAKGKLESTDGKTGDLNTKSGHLTWWPYFGVVRRVRFEEPVKCL